MHVLITLLCVGCMYPIDHWWPCDMQNQLVRVDDLVVDLVCVGCAVIYVLAAAPLRAVRRSRRCCVVLCQRRYYNRAIVVVDVLLLLPFSVCGRCLSSSSALL